MILTGPRPVGDSAAAIFMQEVWDIFNDPKKSLFLSGDGLELKMEKQTNGTYKPIVSIPKQQSSFRWQSPKELDPSVSVAKDTLVYISSGNALVTTGLIDIVSATLTFSKPGIWQAAKDVPAENDGYNVPQFPYPGATGIPSGTPLSGDLDGENVFWIFISPEPCS
jgi:hypothetical protein